MNVEYINPFIQAAQHVMGQFGVPSNLGKMLLKNSPQLAQNVAVLVGVTGTARGQVVYSMNTEAALHLASSMMGGFPCEALDEMSKSAVSELGNMISGNAMTFFSQSDIVMDITPPTLLVGENMEITSFKGERILSIPLEIAVGSMEINIMLKEA